MLTGERHRLAVEEPAHDLHGLGQAGLAHRGRIEPDADRVVLGGRMTRADAELHPAATQVIERRQLAGQMHGVTKVVVEHQRTESYPLGRRRDRAERRQRRPTATDVVRGVHDVESAHLRGA